MWGRLIFPTLVALLVGLAHYLVFVVVPSERVMGAVQRVLYFHVGAAVSTYLMVGFMLVGSLAYVATRDDGWDLVARSAAPVALLLSTIVLATGMIWGHSSWNTWWRWEPRLTSFLVLWFLLFAYALLRSFSAGDEREPAFAAVLGVLIAVNVPIVIFSVKLLSHTEQLHPEVVANQGLRDARYVVAFVLGIVAVAAASIWLWLVQWGNLVLARRAERLMQG